MTGRRVGRVLSEGGRKVSTNGNAAKSLPTILSRKRKNDQDDPMQQADLHSYFNTVNHKSDEVENLTGVSFSQIQHSRPSSRVPLATLNVASDNAANIGSGSLSQPTPELGEHMQIGGYAMKLPSGARHHSEPTLGGDSTPSRPSPGQAHRRKQNLSWKKPRMRDSWNEFRSFIAEPLKCGARGKTPLPELSWADRQEIWDLCAKKETGMYLRGGAEHLLARHPALQPRMRAILLDWLVEVCEVYRLHRETFYLAVDFIDRFLGVAPAVPKNRLQLIGVTCLFIGAKIEEIYPPKLQEFAYVTDGACTEEEILQMELMILKGLNWGLSPMTPNAWVRMFLQTWHGSKEPADESFSLPAYSGLPFSRVMQLLDLAMLDVGSLEFPYSILATSALYHTEDEATALAVSGYKWKDIEPCVRWMSAFAFAIRERSPLQPKSFHGISPDDAHHLQTHSVDLALLERAQKRLQDLASGSLRDSPDPTSQTIMAPMGLENTPQEGEGDIMYPPQNASQLPRGNTSNNIHPAMLSPPLESDIW